MPLRGGGRATKRGQFVWADKGTHKGCPYGGGGRATKRGDSLLGGQGHPQGVPLTGRWKETARGVTVRWGGQGHPQGVPLRVGGRATSGGQFVWADMGTHEGCPYGLVGACSVKSRLLCGEDFGRSEKGIRVATLDCLSRTYGDRVSNCYNGAELDLQPSFSLVRLRVEQDESEWRENRARVDSKRG